MVHHDVTINDDSANADQEKHVWIHRLQELTFQNEDGGTVRVKVFNDESVKFEFTPADSEAADEAVEFTMPNKWMFANLCKAIYDSIVPEAQNAES